MNTSAVKPVMSLMNEVWFGEDMFACETFRWKVWTWQMANPGSGRWR
jgi:hypothetical protein